MMRKNKREKQFEKLALAAFLLGVFALNPLPAQAEEAAVQNNPLADLDIPLAKREGLSWKELRQISPDFKIEVKNDELVFSGTMPAKCAIGRSMGEVISESGQHQVTINLSNCSVEDRSAPEKVAVARAFPAKVFDVSKDGTICLRHSPLGDGQYRCDNVELVEGQALFHQSKASKDAEEKRKLAEEKRIQRVKDHDADFKQMKDKVELLCKQGDYKAVKDELAALASFGVDLTSMLGQVDKVAAQNQERAIKRAKDADSLREAYEAYKAAAEGQGLDTEKVDLAFKERRYELLREQLADGKLKPEQAAAEIRGLVAELNDFDLYDKESDNPKIAWLYGEVVNKLFAEGKHDQADRYFEDVLKYKDSLADKAEAEKEMARKYNEAAEECLEKNAANPGRCDKLAKRASAHHGKMVDLMKKDKNSEWEAAAVEQVTMFGYSRHVAGIPKTSMTLGPLGSVNPYMPSTYEKRKAEVFYTHQREQFIQQMYGMGGAAGSSGGYTSIYAK